jgi:hypothetical protein
MEGRWAELPKLLKIAKEGDDFQFEITGRKRWYPNAPGSSRRRHFDRANSKRTMTPVVYVPAVTICQTCLGFNEVM